MVDTRIPFADRLLLPSGPVPSGALFFQSSKATVLTFDRNLQAGPLDPTNWTTFADGGRYTYSAANASGTQVVLSGPSAPDLSALNGIDYDADPADVLDLAGRAAAAFEKFPVTVVP